MVSQNNEKWLYRIYRGIIVLLKTVYDVGIYGITQIPTIFMFIIKNIFYVRFMSFVILFVILIFTIIMNFFPELIITTRYYIDFMWVEIINISNEFYNILIELFGLGLSSINYPIEILRVFFFEIHDNLCKDDNLFDCLGGQNYIWAIKIWFLMLIEMFKILAAFTTGIQIAMRDFICNQGIIYEGEEAGICFYEYSAINIIYYTIIK